MEQAEEYIKKAIEISDSSAAVLEHMGDVYFYMDKFTEAKTYWEKALQLDISNKSLKLKMEKLK